jgi:hypothetical protein
MCRVPTPYPTPCRRPAEPAARRLRLLVGGPGGTAIRVRSVCARAGPHLHPRPRRKPHRDRQLPCGPASRSGQLNHGPHRLRRRRGRGFQESREMRPHALRDWQAAPPCAPAPAAKPCSPGTPPHSRSPRDHGRRMAVHRHPPPARPGTQLKPQPLRLPRAPSSRVSSCQRAVRSTASASLAADAASRYARRAPGCPRRLRATPRPDHYYRAAKR